MDYLNYRTSRWPSRSAIATVRPLADSLGRKLSTSSCRVAGEQPVLAYDKAIIIIVGAGAGEEERARRPTHRVCLCFVLCCVLCFVCGLTQKKYVDRDD